MNGDQELDLYVSIRRQGVSEELAKAWTKELRETNVEVAEREVARRVRAMLASSGGAS